MANYKQSPKGPARHCHVNQPDTKFNADGLFHLEVGCEGEVAEAFRKEIDEATEAALANHIKDLKPAEQKKWSAHYPYIIEENEDTGAPTGRIWVKFKQNAVIMLKDGTQKPVEISIRDTKNRPSKVKVFSGDEVKVMYSMRDTVATSNKTVGVRLDFCAVMMVNKKQRDSGFTEEDGYEERHEAPASEKPSDGADY